MEAGGEARAALYRRAEEVGSNIPRSVLDCKLIYCTIAGNAICAGRTVDA